MTAPEPHIWMPLDAVSEHTGRTTAALRDVVGAFGVSSRAVDGTLYVDRGEMAAALRIEAEQESLPRATVSQWIDALVGGTPSAGPAGARRGPKRDERKRPLFGSGSRLRVHRRKRG